MPVYSLTSVGYYVEQYVNRKEDCIKQQKRGISPPSVEEENIFLSPHSLLHVNWDKGQNSNEMPNSKGTAFKCWISLHFKSF